MFSTVTLRKTAAESITGVKAVASRVGMQKYRNLGIAAVAVFVAFVGRWELKIPADFKILPLPQNEWIARAQTAGTLAEVLVHEGSVVRKGDVLARTRDFDKEQKVSELSGEIQEKRSLLDLLRAGPRREEIDQKRKAVETRKVGLANATRNEEEKNRLQQRLEIQQLELRQAKQDLDLQRQLAERG